MDQQARRPRHKIVDIVEFPLPTVDSRQMCRQAIDKALAAIESTRAQLACLEIQAFFDKHPNVETIVYDGSWDSNDEGGSDFNLSASFDFVPGSPNDADDHHWLLSDQASGIVSQWGETVDGEKFHREGGAAYLGTLILDKNGYAQWRSEVERLELDKASAHGAPSAEDPIRL